MASTTGHAGAPWHAELHPAQHPHPDLPVTSPDSDHAPFPRAAESTTPETESETAGDTTHWPNVNPLAAYYTPGHLQPAESPRRMDVDGISRTPERHMDGRASSVSLDDPDVRLAAEALGDLRADFVSSPSAPSRAVLPASSEPLLSLLTTSHPLLAKTIEGTTSAYNTSKNFSPRIKSSVEYVEGYLTPLGNTLGSVGRVTGVEDGVRWFLKAGRRHQRTATSDLETGDSTSKRRRLAPATDGEGKADTDMLGFCTERRPSLSTVESLPAYDEQRSPAYTEVAERPRQLDGSGGSGPGRASAAWQSRLIMSTSGLSIAMSEESLRSLKYCLNWLRWANDHIGSIIGALKQALEQLDSHEARRLEQAQHDGTAANDAGLPSSTHAEHSALAAKITALRGDVLRTLRGVIDTVSKYAGGALPDNAKVLVRRHLNSLPQRFRLASHTDAAAAAAAGVEGGSPHADGDGNDLKESAQRVLVLACEGLDMMSQVSGVLDGTIVSAEEWCERLGKKKREERSQRAAGGVQADVVMR